MAPPNPYGIKTDLTEAQILAEAEAMMARQRAAYDAAYAAYRADPYGQHVKRRYDQIAQADVVVMPPLNTLEECAARVAVQARQGFPASHQDVAEEMVVRARRVAA